MKQQLTIRNKFGSKRMTIIKNTKNFYVFLYSLWHLSLSRRYQGPIPFVFKVVNGKP